MSDIEMQHWQALREAVGCPPERAVSLFITDRIDALEQERDALQGRLDDALRRIAQYQADWAKNEPAVHWKARADTAEASLAALCRAVMEKQAPEHYTCLLCDRDSDRGDLHHTDCVLYDPTAAAQAHDLIHRGREQRDAVRVPGQRTCPECSDDRYRRVKEGHEAPQETVETLPPLKTYEIKGAKLIVEVEFYNREGVCTERARMSGTRAWGYIDCSMRCGDVEAVVVLASREESER